MSDQLNIIHYNKIKSTGPEQWQPEVSENASAVHLSIILLVIINRILTVLHITAAPISEENAIKLIEKQPIVVCSSMVKM